MAQYGGGYGGGNAPGPYGSAGGGEGYGGKNSPYGQSGGVYGGSMAYDEPRRNTASGYGNDQLVEPMTRPPASHESRHGAPEEFFKIVCQANPSFYLTDRGGELVLAPGDESNPRQQWVKDASHSHKKDKEGFPAFAVINKGSGLALYHDDRKDRVYLRPYEPNASKESFLWSCSADVGQGYQCIRPFTDIHLNLDADHGDKDHGGIKDGTSVILHKWNKQENQKWRILPITTTGAFAQNQSAGTETVKISCEARPDYYITARVDGVVLAAGEESDPRQEWFKDVRLAANMKDESGSPAFVLVNKATHKALKHGNKEFDKVELVTLHGNQADESLLWTLSADVGKGYRCLRPVRDIHLNLDASHGDSKHGGVHDGTELILFKWLKRENQKWKLTYL